MKIAKRRNPQLPRMASEPFLAEIMPFRFILNLLLFLFRLFQPGG